jgi:hypothetical protein
MTTRRKRTGGPGRTAERRREAIVKIASALFAVLGLSVSTIVTMWLVGSLVAWSVDAAGEAGQDILVQFSTPWLGGKHAPTKTVRQSEAPAALAVAKASH